MEHPFRIIYAYYYALQNLKELGGYLLEANEFNYDVPNYFEKIQGHASKWQKKL